MAMNPFEEKGIPLETQTRPWTVVNVVPYDTRDVHPTPVAGSS